uniref:Nucleoporin NDC1-like n=1 Tax=Saccoglossus kowalevskii TaxID=10224 RepID=A0ABM0N0G0_SACKO|nr:PREDICTED: nucleoporin NDC1-like [Saccoglossus kowalevskii]
MANIHHWFLKEVFRWRTGASIAWAIILLPLFTSVYVVIARIDPLHPYTWIIGCIKDLLSFTSFGYLVLLSIITGFVGVFNAKYYTVTPVVHRTRLALLLNTVNVYTVFHAICHGIAAGLMTWCLTAVGFLYGMNYFIKQENYMAFPVVQQAKLFRMKSYLATCVLNSAWKTLTSMKYLYLVYYLLGVFPKTWIIENFNLEGTNTVPLDSMMGLLDVYLFWLVLTTGTLVYTLWYFTLQVFKVFNTQAFSFPVESTFAEDADKCLPMVMAERQIPLVQFLAFLDLSMLAEHSVHRRKQIFSLSQPGGHAHNWNYISKECLATVEILTNNLLLFQDNVQVDGLRQQRVSGPTATPTCHPVKQLFSSPTPYIKPAITGATGKDSPLWDSSVAQSPAVYRTHASMLNRTESPLWDDTYAQSPAVYRHTAAAKELMGANGIDKSTTKQSTSPKKSSFIENLKRRSLIAYFISPLPEVPSREIFVNAQVNIWTIEALSRLVAASYTEDQYGVVQQSLHDILTAMLTLQITLDKHLKLPVLAAKLSRQTKTAEENLKFCLRTTLKCALYRIVATFGEHLRNVKLDAEFETRLAQFMEYRE